jgi:hypothetical protein
MRLVASQAFQKPFFVQIQAANQFGFGLFPPDGVTVDAWLDVLLVATKTQFSGFLYQYPTIACGVWVMTIGAMTFSNRLVNNPLIHSPNGCVTKKAEHGQGTLQVVLELGPMGAVADCTGSACDRTMDEILCELTDFVIVATIARIHVRVNP